MKVVPERGGMGIHVELPRGFERGVVGTLFDPARKVRVWSAGCSVDLGAPQGREETDLAAGGPGAGTRLAGPGGGNVDVEAPSDRDGSTVLLRAEQVEQQAVTVAGTAARDDHAPDGDWAIRVEWLAGVPCWVESRSK
ncbi:MAG: hypothetical protein Kow00109_02040 [Acidobacteriota bacterium]